MVSIKFREDMSTWWWRRPDFVIFPSYWVTNVTQTQVIGKRVKDPIRSLVYFANIYIFKDSLPSQWYTQKWGKNSVFALIFYLCDITPTTKNTPPSLLPGLGCLLFINQALDPPSRGVVPFWVCGRSTKASILAFTQEAANKKLKPRSDLLL